MKRLDVGMVVRYDGKLAEVYAIGEGRTISLQFIGEDDCPTCGRRAGVSILEHAPLLQDKLEPVQTISLRLNREQEAPCATSSSSRT